MRSEQLMCFAESFNCGLSGDIVQQIYLTPHFPAEMRRWYF